MDVGGLGYKKVREESTITQRHNVHKHCPFLCMYPHSHIWVIRPPWRRQAVLHSVKDITFPQKANLPLAMRGGWKRTPPLQAWQQTSLARVSSTEKKSIIYCKEEGCSRNAHYNFKEERHTAYCSDHKRPHMVNFATKHRKCQEEGCNKVPSFNVKGKTRGIFCTKHKRPKMVDVRNKRCQEEGCNL